MPTTAAIVATIVSIIGVAVFLFAFYLSTHEMPTEDHATTAIVSAIFAGFLFIFGGAPLLFLNPVIAGFLFAVGVLLFAYSYWIEAQLRGYPPDPAQLPDHARGSTEQDELGAATADLDRGHRWSITGAPLTRYPASWHEQRNRGGRR